MHAFSCSLETNLSWKQCLPVFNSIYSGQTFILT